jgi:ABC-2 type transport system permease protein
MKLDHVFRLGIKEFWSLLRDPMMLVLIVYAFTLAIYVVSRSAPETLSKVPVAIVDEDRSQLSARITTALQPPYFLPPEIIAIHQMDAGMDAGRYTFTLNIPPNFQRDLLAGRNPAIQLNVDATRMSQAFTGNGYITQIIHSEVTEFVQGHRGSTPPSVQIEQRMRFNPTLTQTWTLGVMEIINMITTLSIVLTGAALIREREHGTIEHLLVMPVTPTEIMLSKIWSMAVVVLLATAMSITFVIQGWLEIPIEGSVPLFLLVTALHLFSTTSLGIFMATLARTMPQFGLLMMLVTMPLQLLSGASTPRESMPEFVQNVMLLAPTTHFVSASQAILYRGAGLETVWPQTIALLTIGTVFFSVSLARFRKTLASMA